MTTETSKKDKQKNSGLKKCFAALVDRKQVNLEFEVIQLIIEHELGLKPASLQENLVSILPFMLVVYIKKWPGWQRSKEYYSGKLKFKEWYEKFRQYTIIKMNYVVKSGYGRALEMIRDDQKGGRKPLLKTFKDSGTQTDNSRKELAPFSLVLQCPPVAMNSLFVTDVGDDIILKQHPALPWTPIGLLEMLNWPHVGVTFQSKDLVFKRYNRTQYVRYLLSGNCPIVPEKSEFIEKVEISNPELVRTCYTLNMLKCYTDQLFAVLASMDSVSSDYVQILKVVVNEFLKDIEEIEMNNTIATNTSVLFNIGKSSFFRNKKISKGANSQTRGPQLEVGYWEHFIPKMEIELTHFNAIQDTRTNETTFVSLNILKENAAVINARKETAFVLPSLLFSCVFCDLSYRNSKQILTHLESEHKMEPNCLCDKCMKLISIPALSKVRWKHACRPAVNGQNSRAPVGR